MAKLQIKMKGQIQREKNTFLPLNFVVIYSPPPISASRYFCPVFVRFFSKSNWWLLRICPNFSEEIFLSAFLPKCFSMHSVISATLHQLPSCSESGLVKMRSMMASSEAVVLKRLLSSMSWRVSSSVSQ